MTLIRLLKGEGQVILYSWSTNKGNKGLEEEGYPLNISAFQKYARAKGPIWSARQA